MTKTRWQTALTLTLALAITALTVSGCKDVISPHVQPEGDPTRLVASMAAATNQALMARAGADQQIVLTLNNAPEANEPLEQDFITELVELFEKRNPNIRIQYSPWQYTPESFFERLNNRTLTDIVEVDAEQMVPIIEANAAADLTENVKVTPEMRIMNPDVFTVTSKEGRTYGVPVELHTMALFYNRRLFEASKVVVPAETQKSEDKEKGKGAAGEPRDYVFNDLHPQLDDTPMELAQYAPAPYYYPPGYQAPQRQQQQQQQQQQESPRRSSTRRSSQQDSQQSRQRTQQEQQQEYYRQYYQQYYQQQGYPGYQAPGQQQSAGQGEQEDARERRMKSRQRRDRDREPEDGERPRQDDDDSDTASRRDRKKTGSEDDDEKTTSSETPDDTLTPDAELALQEQKTTATDGITTVIETAGLPRDLEQFIRLAVRLTDHKKEIAGYAPVLYASEGGREYTQWSIMHGLNMQSITGDTVTLDVAKAGEVAQFIKDLHWRFDVTPAPSKCYYDNLMTMFAEGKLAMMMLPAQADVIAELIKRGMPMEDIGVTALPRGMATRDHLTYGKCLVVNSQLDKTRRTAAFKWLMFMASPEVQRLRTQFFFREREMTAGPSVPLYSAQMQKEFYESIRGYRALPLWQDYESVVASNLRLEPSYETDRFYEALAEGLRPIIERKDSDPFHAVTLMASDFERKYIIGEEPDNILDRYVHFLMKKKEN